MELTIQQGDLAFAVARALGSVSSKSPLPLLSCVLIEAEKGGLRVTGTDLDVTTSVSVPCTVSSPGKVAVSARHFHEVIRKMPKGTLTMAVRDGQCQVDYGEGKGWSRFPVQDPADFPRIPELKGEARVTLDGAALSRLASRTVYAASTEETRPQLNGVLVLSTEKSVTFVSTDGHRLARTTRRGDYAGLAAPGIIVPTRALQAVNRTAEEATSPVEIEVAVGRNQAGFSTQVGEYRVQILTRLLEGAYPNYEQVIPKDNPRELTARRADLMEAIDIVASHADNVTRQVRFSVRKGALGVSSTTPELGAGEQKLVAEYDGEALEIGYNAGYLLEVLRSIPTEQVLFRLKTSLSAAVIEPVGALPQSDEDLLCLIMPLRLPDAGELAVESLSGLLPRVLKRLGLEQGLLGWRAVREWEQIVGPRIARHSRAVAYRDGSLQVEVDGSAWMQELGFLKRDLVRKVNEHMGSRLVKDVRFIVPRGGILR